MKLKVGYTLLAFFLAPVTGCAQDQSSVANESNNLPHTDTATAELLDQHSEYQPQEASELLSRGLMSFASNYHIADQSINEALAMRAAENYVRFLDSSKSYLLDTEVDNFYESAQAEGVRWLSNGKLGPAYELYNLFIDRLMMRSQWIVETLEGGDLDLERGGEFKVDPDVRQYASSLEAQDELWKDRLVSETIGLMLNQELSQAEAEEKLIKRYEGNLRRVLSRRDEEVFQTWMNAQLNGFDPHTVYFSPRSTEDFDINMSLSLEGIGARLSEIDDYVTIIEIIAGGPAEQSGQLEPRDRIVAVAQGEDGEFVDVVGWRVSDVVELIRGKRGSIVRLSVMSKTGNQKTVQLERDKIDLEEQAAQGELKTIEDEAGNSTQVGVITLPSFYSDFSRNSQRNASDDVKQQLQTLMEQGAEGIVLDLRGNGGGSLEEAIEITGLFVPQNTPVVQVKSSGESVTVHRTEEQPVYDGPLALMIDRTSASASEILAAVMQDFGRGIVIGQTTFGKGTVQNLIDNQRLVSTDNTGQIKITTAKFYRISGGSTQHKGVTPDIKLPSSFDTSEIGESAQENALSWSQIAPVLYRPGGISDDVLATLQGQSTMRQTTSEGFKALNREISFTDQVRNRLTLPLSLKQRRILNDQDKKEELNIENAWRALEGKSPLSELAVKSEEDRIIESANDDEGPDPWLEESMRILQDYISILQSNTSNSSDVAVQG